MPGFRGDARCRLRVAVNDRSGQGVCYDEFRLYDRALSVAEVVELTRRGPDAL